MVLPRMGNSEYQVKKFARDQELYDLGAIYSSPLNPHVCALDHRRTTGKVLVFARVYDDPKFCYEKIGEFPCGDGEECGLIVIVYPEGYQQCYDDCMRDIDDDDRRDQARCIAQGFVPPDACEAQTAIDCGLAPPGAP